MFLKSLSLFIREIWTNCLYLSERLSSGACACVCVCVCVRVCVCVCVCVCSCDACDHIKTLFHPAKKHLQPETSQSSPCLSSPSTCLLGHICLCVCVFVCVCVCVCVSFACVCLCVFVLVTHALLLHKQCSTQ